MSDCCVVEAAESTTATARGTVQMIERDRQRIHDVHDLAVKRVVVKPPKAAESLGLSEPPIYGAVSRLEEAGILREVTGRARGKTYIYGEYMDILNEGTEV